MAEQSPRDMTLREMLNNAERLTREFAEHLEQNFVPKAHTLRKLTRPTVTGHVDEEVEDITVRNAAAEVLKSEQFTRELYEKVGEYCAAIDEAVARIKT